MTAQKVLNEVLDAAGGRLQVDTGSGGTVTQVEDITVDGTVGGVTLLAANADRKGAVIQNTGTDPVRVSFVDDAPTATFGLQIPSGATLDLSMPYCPTGAVKAIREGAVSSTVSVLEIT